MFSFSLPNEKREHFVFKKPGSFIEVVIDDDLKQLITDVLIGLKDYEALSQLPLYLRTKNNVRYYFSLYDRRMCNISSLFIDCVLLNLNMILGQWHLSVTA